MPQNDQKSKPLGNTNHAALSISLASLFVAALWFYVQLQEWKSLGPGHDYKALVMNVAVTVVMWTLLVTGIVLQRKQAPRIKALQTTIAEQTRTIRNYQAATPVETQAAFGGAQSDYERLAFQKLKGEFKTLPWAQKIALKCILAEARQHESRVYEKLKTLGFGSDISETIIVPLKRTGFVRVSDSGGIEPDPTRARMVERLINEWNRNPV